MTQTRRLAAILAADVAGYSRLIGADEEGTLNRLKSIRAEIIDPKISEHRGRIVKTTGDGLLVEFGSVVDALRCATEWQHAMVAHYSDQSGNPIEFRLTERSRSCWCPRPRHWDMSRPSQTDPVSASSQSAASSTTGIPGMGAALNGARH